MHTLDEISKLCHDIKIMNFKKNYPDIKKIGLYPGQPELLKTLITNEGIGVRELARITNREPSTIAKSLKRLENSGYILKSLDDNDKRNIKIYITEKGKKSLEQLDKMFEDNKKMYANILNQNEIGTLYNILHKIKNELEGDIG